MIPPASIARWLMHDNFYRTLYRIRRVEEEIARVYPSDDIKSPVHLSIGQEAISVGICQALQLGDVVFVELPEIGRQVAKDSEAAVVESVKAASEVYAPVTGEVVEVNNALGDEPEMVNGAPMGDGWFFKIRISNPSEIDELMDEAAYQEFVKGL